MAVVLLLKLKLNKETKKIQNYVEEYVLYLNVAKIWYYKMGVVHAYTFPAKYPLVNGIQVWEFSDYSIVLTQNYCA